ncbi:MAG TPA: regulatory protein RecX [Bacteroidia bacterium]|nr:regulatory protein RecX [Bacteroidia bacterium]
MENNSFKKRTEPSAALVKAEAWCAFQERCQQEARDKLYSWGLHRDEVENIISELISRGFLNEERFARAYAGGKFRIKKWGRVKIMIELKRRKISDYCLRKAMEEIDEDDYLRVLKKIIADKMRTEKEKNPLKKKLKVMRYAVSRGYENDLVRGIMEEDE